jgi:RNA polymerase sigma-70 factor (ECF subfamily)
MEIVMPPQPSPLDPSDESLFALFRDRQDDAALDELVRRHWAPSYRLALAIVRDAAGAEDLAQEALIGLVQTARAKRRVDTVGPWLRSAVVNRSRNFLRSRRRRTAHEERAARADVAAADASGAVGEYAEALPEKLRVPLVLHYGLGYTHAEVAQAVGCPVGTASSRIREGVERVRAELLGAGSALSVGAVELALAAATGGAAKVAAPPAPEAAWIVAQASARATLGFAIPLAAKKAAAAGAILLGALALATVVARPDEPAASRPASSPSTAATAPLASCDAAPSVGAVGSAGDERRVAWATGGRPAPTAAATITATDTAPPPDPSRPRLRGRIVDARGAAVAGARVQVKAVASEPNDLSSDPKAARAFDAFKRVLRAAIMVNDGVRDRTMARMAEMRSFNRSRDATSAEDGTFSVDGSLLPKVVLDPDAFLIIRARNVRGSEVDAGERYLASKDLKDLGGDLGDVVIERLPVLTVLVRASGALLEGAKVDFGSADDLGEGRPDAPLTDASGRARHVTSEESLTLTVTKERFAQERRFVELEGDVNVEVDLVPQAELAGRVVDPEGRPVAGATIAAVASDGTGDATPLSTTADEQGRFSLPNIGAGRAYDLKVHAPGDSFVEGALRITAPASDAVVTLVRSTTVVVEVKTSRRLSEEDSNRLVSSLVLEREEKDGWTPADAELAPPSGDPLRLRFVRASPGRHRVRWTGGIAGLAPAASEPFSVDPRRGAVVTLELASGRTVRGRVVDESGRPIAGALVSLADQDQELLGAETGADGTFTIADAPLGEVGLAVAAVTSDGSVLTGEAFVAPGENVPDIVVAAARAGE